VVGAGRVGSIIELKQGDPVSVELGNDGKESAFADEPNPNASGPGRHRRATHGAKRSTGTVATNGMGSQSVHSSDEAG
jgi:hypothetical protein